MTIAIPQALVAEPFYAEYGHPLHAWRIMDRSGRCVDVVRSGLTAARDVDLLNAGHAHVDHHARLGCRVVLGTT